MINGTVITFIPHFTSSKKESQGIKSMWEITEERLDAILFTYVKACTSKIPDLAGITYVMLIQANDYYHEKGEEVICLKIATILTHYHNFGLMEALSGEVGI